jgi:hypothetical protein
MQRLSDKAVLKQTILSSISQTVAGPFAYAESFDKANNKYIGLVIENGMNTPVALTNESVIVEPTVAEKNRLNPAEPDPKPPIDPQPGGSGGVTDPAPKPEPLPTKFKGTINLSSERPARDFGKVVDGIIDQITNIEGAEINLTLEIHADVPNGIEKNKQRTLIENANTLGFVDKNIIN